MEGTLIGQTSPRGLRRPVRIPNPELGEQWVAQKRLRRHTDAGPDVPRRHQAYILLANEAEPAEGVVEAASTEMMEFAKNRRALSFQARGDVSPSYLLAEAPSVFEVAECLDEARVCLENIILDTTAKVSVVHVEPPSYSSGVVEVRLEHFQGSNYAHLAMLPCAKDLCNTPQSISKMSSFRQLQCYQLAAALKRAGRIKDVVNLRVRFGRFMLLSYPTKTTAEGLPATRYEFGQLCQLIQHPRTIGELQTRMGDLGEALRTLAAIKESGSLFFPEDMVSFPEYRFEAYSPKYRFEAQLRPLGQGTGVCKVSHVQAYKTPQGDGSGVQLDFKTLNLNDALDWKIETDHETLVDVGYEGFKSEMRAATVLFNPGEGGKDEDYPRVHFSRGHKLADSLKQVAIKNVFRFRYSQAPYKLEFTIRREWGDIRAMHSKKELPVTTYDITVYGENWGEVRASEIARTGQGWGKELENLFYDDLDCGIQDLSGQERVGRFVDTVQRIRQALILGT